MLRWVKNAIGATLLRAGYRIGRVDQIPEDLSDEDRESLLSSRPFSCTSVERLVTLIEATRYVARRNIPGAIVECGVWKGGSMMAVAQTLLKEEMAGRQLYLYDTFSGMSEPGDKDRDYGGRSAAVILSATEKNTGVWCYAGLEEVRKNMLSTGYPTTDIHYVVGKVEETLLSQVPEQIALLRLDTDWYASTRQELQTLYPRLVAGGVLIIDDYGHWRGAKDAVDEYFSSVQERPLFCRIDYTGRLAIKP